MNQVGKGQAIYVVFLGVLFVTFLAILLAVVDCRQTSDLTACSLRWGNYGLSVQYSDQLVIWLLGFNDVRLWPLRQNIPLALFWSISLMTISLLGMALTLLVASIDHLFQIVRKSVS